MRGFSRNSFTFNENSMIYHEMKYYWNIISIEMIFLGNPCARVHAYERGEGLPCLSMKVSPSEGGIYPRRGEGVTIWFPQN